MGEPAGRGAGIAGHWGEWRQTPTANWRYNSAQPRKTANEKFVSGNVDLYRQAASGSLSHGATPDAGGGNGVGIFCSSPNFFTFGTKTSGTGVKHYIWLTNEDVKVTLHPYRLSLNPTVYATLQLLRKTRQKTAKYPLVRSETRSFSFSGQTTLFTEDNVFVGKMLDRMIVALVDSRAFNGDLE